MAAVFFGWWLCVGAAGAYGSACIPMKDLAACEEAEHISDRCINNSTGEHH